MPKITAISAAADYAMLTKCPDKRYADHWRGGNRRVFHPRRRARRAKSTRWPLRYNCFDARRSPSLPNYVRRRLETIAAKTDQDGEIVITANSQRTKTRTGATRYRLITMIDEAAQRPKFRVATKPGKAARKRRTNTKTRRGQIKKLRSHRIGYDE